MLILFWTISSVLAVSLSMLFGGCRGHHDVCAVGGRAEEQSD
jgi:hypothetical protein